MNNGGKLIHKWLHYFDIYEKHFERLRERPIKFLEIGVFEGGSLGMWKEYFHEDSVIVGIDLNPDCKPHEGEGIHVRIGNQADEDFLAEVIAEFGEFDIILDDGSHMNDHVIKTFEFLYPKTSPTGVYLIEDMHTSYWDGFGGGLNRSGSMIEYFKTKIDELNAVHVSEENYEISDLSRSTWSMTFYDSILAIEKRPQGGRIHMRTARM